MTAKENIFKIIKAVTEVIETQKWEMEKVKTALNDVDDDNNNSTALTTFLDALQGNFLTDQWLGLLAFTAKDAGSIPGRGTKIPQAAGHGQKYKQILKINK